MRVQLVDSANQSAGHMQEEKDKNDEEMDMWKQHIILIMQGTIIEKDKNDEDMDMWKQHMENEQGNNHWLQYTFGTPSNVVEAHEFIKRTQNVLILVANQSVSHIWIKKEEAMDMWKQHIKEIKLPHAFQKYQKVVSTIATILQENSGHQNENSHISNKNRNLHVSHGVGHLKIYLQMRQIFWVTINVPIILGFISLLFAMESENYIIGASFILYSLHNICCML
ncbi:hypothetical protein ACJX0J_031012, partial [Zea mays]